jgi:HD superfamily phosphodiesterase
MKRQQIIDIARADFGDVVSHEGREPGFIFRHGQAVAALSVTLAREVDEAIDVSEDVLFCGGLFHDCAKTRSNHAAAGAKRVRKLLAGKLPSDDLAAVAHLVEHHNDRNDPDHVTAVKVLQDADALEHFGAENVWLAVYFAATHGRDLPDTIRFYRHEEKDGYHAKVRASLNFEVSRCEFDRRIAFSDAFYAELEHENSGGLGTPASSED